MKYKKRKFKYPSFFDPNSTWHVVNFRCVYHNQRMICGISLPGFYTTPTQLNMKRAVYSYWKQMYSRDFNEDTCIWNGNEDK